MIQEEELRFLELLEKNVIEDYPCWFLAFYSNGDEGIFFDPKMSKIAGEHLDYRTVENGHRIFLTSEVTVLFKAVLISY